ncbi:MAG: DsbA family protein [Ginsengibacter sp.]
MDATLIYCYDAWCGWCYGFSQVIKKINDEYKNRLQVEVLSGGMILPEEPVSIGATAGYISEAYKRVEEVTGAKFGEDYLWHIFHPAQSDWFPHSEKPAIALCVFKEYYPDQQVSFATDLEYALNFEGRDLTDDEAYRHLLEKYDIDAADFYEKMTDNSYKEEAYYEFQLCSKLQVNSFPALLVQTSETKFTMISKGYTDYQTVMERLDNLLAENNF